MARKPGKGPRRGAARPKLSKESDAFARRIRDLRKRQRMTRSQLAKAVGSTFAACYQWEVMGREPRYETLVRLARALGTTPAFIMTGVKDASTSAAADLPETIEDLVHRVRSEAAAIWRVGIDQVRAELILVEGPRTGRVKRKVEDPE